MLTMSQTISLFRYQIAGIVNRRFFALLLIICVIGLAASSFIAELSIINSQQISNAALADYFRYILVLLSLLIICNNIAQDYEFRLFERILSMPVSRWQYVAAQILLVMAVNLILVVPVLLLFSFLADFQQAIYWTTAVWLELLLVGCIGLLAIISLEKLPSAIMLSLALYLLVKFSGLISLMLSESVRLNESSSSSVFVESIFKMLQNVLPSAQSFASNNIFFESFEPLQLLGPQLLLVLIYSTFLMMICLVDFYRKEFNL